MELRQEDIGSLRDVTQHFESSVDLKAPCAAVFEHLHDFTKFGEHMMRSSWMMAGSAMRYEFDDARGRAQGATVRLLGSFLGLRLQIDERVVERAPPYRKSWETLGRARMIILKGYRMGFDLTAQGTGSGLRVFIDYVLPERGLTRLIGRAFGSMYARWCVRSVVEGAIARFDSPRP